MWIKNANFCVPIQKNRLTILQKPFIRMGIGMKKKTITRIGVFWLRILGNHLILFIARGR